MPSRARGFVLLCLALGMGFPAVAAEPLHDQIDQLIAAKAGGQQASPRAADAEFVRRIYLDLAGRIPSVVEARSFLQEKAPDKRAKLIDQLLASADYPRHMQEQFHIVLMERLGDNPEWTKFLRASFAANKPWDQLAREILSGAPNDEASRGAAFFYAKRLENYGQNPVDYPALTRDVGRLFLGIDLQCAQCHDHRFIKDYKQHDFQGLFAFFQNAFLQDAKKPAVGEKVMTKKLEFQSVFNKVKKETGPKIPGVKEIEIPVVKKGEEFVKPPDPKTKAPGIPKFSPLTKLAEQLPAADTPTFSANIVNRLWFLVMGRGLVHPLDLHHSANPPSHPELLALLVKEFVAHKYDIKWLLREMVLSATYQRSSVLPEGSEKPKPESFLTAHEKRLSAEQLLASMLEATGERERVTKDAKALEAVRLKFVKAFANPAREPEDDYAPSLKAALFVLNDDAVLAWLQPQPGNLLTRLAGLAGADQVADELYLSVLTRQPTPEEKADVAKHLAKHPDRRAVALGQLTWALLASTEFDVNH